MTRGCEKRIIHIKDTNSDLFEEAYFILRSDFTEKRENCSKDQMVKEASRIIKDTLPLAYPSKTQRKSNVFVKPFVIGASFSGAVCAVIAITLFLLRLI